MADAAAAPFVHRHRVRYRECDPQGRVFSANYIAFLDDAVTEMWRARFGGYEALAAESVDMVVAEAGIRYIRPALADDQLDVELAVGALGDTSMDIEFLMTRDAARVAAGKLHYVFIDLATERRSEVPAGIRAAIDPHVAR